MAESSVRCAASSEGEKFSVNPENVQENLSFSEKRTKSRLATRLTEKIRISLQSCKASDNEKLEGLLEFYRRNTSKCRILEGLLYIPLTEMHMVFFCGFVGRNVEDKEFRDHLLHEEYGLCVYVASLLDNRIIILQNDTVDTGKFLFDLERLISKEENTFTRFHLDAGSLNRVLQSMDTEYDKSVLKAIIFSSATRKKTYELGIKPENAVGFLYKIVTASAECEQANDAAGDILKLRDKEKLQKIDKKIKTIEDKLSKKESLIAEGRKADLLSEKEPTRKEDVDSE